MSLNSALLIVEDDMRFLETLRLDFEERGYHVTPAHSLTQVMALQISFLFAIVDLRLQSESGLPIVEYLKQTHPKCRIIVLTGFGSIATAVEANKRGATQYLTKPVNMRQLESLLWTDQCIGSQSEEMRETSTLARHEREYIEWVLLQCKSNVTQAANRLGLHRQSLQRKLRKFTPK